MLDTVSKQALSQSREVESTRGIQQCLQGSAGKAVSARAQEECQRRGPASVSVFISYLGPTWCLK